MKLWDTLQAAEAIKPLVKGETGVVSFQKLVFGEVVQVARAQGVPLPAGYADERLAFVD